jgi:hypothetical protein
MIAVYVCSQVSGVGIGSTPYQRCFALFARNRVTPVRYAVFLLAIALLAPLAAVQGSSLPFTLPHSFPHWMSAVTFMLFICMKVTFRVRPSRDAPFLLSNSLIKPGVQELHVLPAQKFVRGNSIGRLANLMAASRARRLTMKSPLLVALNVDAGFLKRLACELTAIGASVSVTRHEPEPIGKFEMAAFWPMRSALARAPKRIKTSSGGDTLMTACVHFDIRWR